MPVTPVLGIPYPFVLGPAISGRRYQSISLIAEGGMGAVYRGHSLDQGNEPVALKLATGAFRNPDESRRFRREIAAVAGLNHPNIVRTLDHGHDERFGPFIVMELLRGQTLYDFLGSKPYGRLSLEETARIGWPLCGALIYAHTRETPLMHRDIKPANIFLSGDPKRPEEATVKVMDFGLARSPDALPQGVGARQKLTEAGMALGTLQYISPEQCQGRPGLASDVYALGVMFYLMLEGRFPFAEDVKDPLALIQWHRRGTPAAMTVCPPAYREFFLSLMEKDPKNRPGLEEVQKILGGILRPEPVVGPASPTLVGIPIPALSADEMLTARSEWPTPEGRVVDVVPPAEALTLREAAEESAVPQEIEDRFYRVIDSSPRLPPRVAAGEISIRENPRRGPASSNKVFHLILHVFGLLAFGWLYRKVSRALSKTHWEA